MSISLICAVAENGAIGHNNRLLFHLRADLQRFKALTSGHTIIMGRNTFESLPKGALPNRRNIVLSRTVPTPWHNTEVFASLQEALEACTTDEKVFIIGGASVYAEALPLADCLYLTHVHANPEAADTYFPSWNQQDWLLLQEESHAVDEQNEVPFTFADYVRRKD